MMHVGKDISSVHKKKFRRRYRINFSLDLNLMAIYARSLRLVDFVCGR